MGWKNTRSAYGTLPIALHWLTLLLLAAVYASMEFKSIFAKGSPGREMMAVWHHSLGLSVFLLTWVRLLVRLAGAQPTPAPGLPRWQAVLAKATHALLYALLIGLPLLGWLTLGARGAPAVFFGAELPALIAENAGRAKWLKNLHETGASVGYLLIAIHAGAAIYHHVVQRDGSLRRMLPGH